MKLFRTFSCALSTVFLLGSSIETEAQSTFDSAMEAARSAAAAGRTEEAYEHLQRARAERPQDRAIFERSLEIAGDDADWQAFWILERALALVDGKGRVAAAKTRTEEIEGFDAEALVRARVSALEELEKRARSLRRPGRKPNAAAVEARWLREVARSVIGDSPALERAFAPSFDAAVESVALAPKALVDVLQSALQRAERSGRHEDALRLARLLVGLGRQAAQRDLQGEKAPDLRGLERSARDAVERAREKLRAEQGEPWTIDQLLELDEEQIARFDEQYASPANPARGWSPSHRYLIETTCGWETLVGVIDTVELHHERLVNWFGEDPFLDRHGTVRIVPEHGDLESEGAPYWWAGGFQSGDLTTVRFAVSNVEALGHTITHELTHRFDGALYPGNPAWWVEGRAVWTGGSYGHSSDDRYPERYASGGSIQAALRKGYGNVRNLEKLLRGTIEDYRDNYTAGYALFVYLDTWEAGAGRRLYHDRWPEFLGARSRDPVDRFQRAFLDGKDGRPADLEEFAAQFQQFLDGFYWQNPAPWTAKYRHDFGRQGGSRIVFDSPTWVYSRPRAEPFFGQDQARAAALLLEELGDEEGAVFAWLVSLEVDEDDRTRHQTLARLLQEQGDEERAWMLTSHPWLGDGADESPLLGRMARVRGLVETTREQREVLRERGLERAVAALDADLARWNRWLRFATDRDLTAKSKQHRLLDPPARALREGGFEEVSLCDYDEHRVRDLWYESEQGDLHVGRKRPRDVTGDLERRAHQRDAFVRGQRYEPAGRYSIRAQIEITTSFVSGAMIFGMTRRDRNLRVGFSAGDFLYAIGQRESGGDVTGVRVRMNGRRERDGALSGSAGGRNLSFAGARPTFALRVEVDGPTATLFIDDERVTTYHTVDGAPIEGHIGFAMGQGAIRVHGAEIARHDRSHAGGAVSPGTLRLGHPESIDPGTLRNRHLEGVPAVEYGQFVLWVPRPVDNDGEPPRSPLRSVLQFREEIHARDWPQPTLVLMPVDGLDPEDVESIRAECAQEPATEIRLHSWSEWDQLEECEQDGCYPWFWFIDPAGALRVSRPWADMALGLDESSYTWVRVHAGLAPPPEGEPVLPPSDGPEDDEHQRP